MANKKVIKLTEQDLHNIINESVNKVLNEAENNSIKIDRVYTSKKGNKHHVEINLDSEEGDSNILSGVFEYWIEDNEDDTYVSGSLHIENGEVIDFDGCFELPKAVKKALNDSGYQTNW